MARRVPRISFSPLGDVKCFTCQKLGHIAVNYKSMQQKKELDRRPYKEKKQGRFPPSLSPQTIRSKIPFYHYFYSCNVLAIRMSNIGLVQIGIEARLGDRSPFPHSSVTLGVLCVIILVIWPKIARY